MNEDTGRSPLDTVEAFEAAAFRVAQVTRKLLAEHPGLPVGEIRPRASAHCAYADVSAQVEIATRDTDAVHAWAAALGTTATVEFHDVRGASRAFEYHGAECTVGGVEVSVCATRRPSEEEIAAWRERQAPTAAAPSDASGGEGR